MFKSELGPIPTSTNDLAWKPNCEVGFCREKQIQKVVKAAMELASGDKSLAKVMLTGVIYQINGNTWGNSLWVEPVENAGPTAADDDILELLSTAAEHYISEDEQVGVRYLKEVLELCEQRTLTYPWEASLYGAMGIDLCLVDRKQLMAETKSKQEVEEVRKVLDLYDRTAGKSIFEWSKETMVMRGEVLLPWRNSAVDQLKPDQRDTLYWEINELAWMLTKSKGVQPRGSVKIAGTELKYEALIEFQKKMDAKIKRR